MAATTTHSSGALWWKATGKGRCGVFAVWKLYDPYLSASAVSFLLWALCKCLSLFFLPNVVLWPFKFQPKTYHVYVQQGHSLYQVWTFWDHSFLSYAPGEKCTYWPCDLDVWPLNPKSVPLPLRTNKQTNKHSLDRRLRTSNPNTKQTYKVGVGNYFIYIHRRARGTVGT